MLPPSIIPFGKPVMSDCSQGDGFLLEIPFFLLRCIYLLGGGQRKREREKSQADSADAEPDAGLNLATLRS